MKDEGALVVLHSGNVGDAGTVFGQQGGSRDPKDPVPPPMVVLTPEHYNRVVRLLDHNIPVKMEFDIQAQFIDTPTDSFNVTGEIEGNRKKDEIVMLGAHLDSWHGGTGATDNATGSAVAIEAVRILKALNLRMDRTVRIALCGAARRKGCSDRKLTSRSTSRIAKPCSPSPNILNFPLIIMTTPGRGVFAESWPVAMMKPSPFWKSG
jgi:hypothetical protein